MAAAVVSSLFTPQGRFELSWSWPVVKGGARLRLASRQHGRQKIDPIFLLLVQCHVKNHAKKADSSIFATDTFKKHLDDKYFSARRKSCKLEQVEFADLTQSGWTRCLPTTARPTGPTNFH